MPDRQIPWRKIANRLSGDLEVKTSISGSRMTLRAEVDGAKLHIEALSAPYSATGGRTEIRAKGVHSTGAKIYLGRDFGKVPRYRRYLLRDVELGVPHFDAYWIINSKREAHAQAYLDEDVRSLIEAVPVAITASSILGESRNVFYDFALRGREALLFSENFETDPDRLSAAIAAAVAMVNQPTTQLTRWRQLAAELDGALSKVDRFRMDGSTHIRFALGGRPLSVSPRIVRLGFRRDRLRTRVSCELASGAQEPALHWKEEDETAIFGEDAELVASAVFDAEIVAIRRTNRSVEVSLDGNVTETERIIASASIAALLSRGSSSRAGPYR